MPKAFFPRATASGPGSLAGLDEGMDKKTAPTKLSKKDAERETRLKAALKANMAKRKAQARARADKET